MRWKRTISPQFQGLKYLDGYVENTGMAPLTIVLCLMLSLEKHVGWW